MSLIGSNISHYKILETLGEGGMGMVFKAEDLKLKRIVAIKILPLQLTRDPDSRRRFSQEAQAASALDHPNICTIYEVDQTEDGQIFLVMAHYEGVTLEQKIKQGALSREEAVKIAIQIAEGLSKAHQKGIVHRDIKPANIFITDDGMVKILDFGLAKLVGEPSVTKKQTSIGTVNYMSPEQARGELVDDRTDIWSLGVVLYEMLSGQFPFRGEYEQAVIYNILNQEPQPIGSLHKGLDKSVENIISKSLVKNPTDRYQTVLELLEDLKKQKDLSNGEVSGKSIAFFKKPQRKQFNLIIWFIPAIALILIVLGVWFLSSEKSEIKSITVLPFTNLNKEVDAEYFSDGITEDIVIQLSKLEGLQVISYRSSHLYKDSEKSLKQIGKELGVNHILHGKVRREDDVLRITAQLVRTDNGEQLWADRFDRPAAEIFDIQEEVAQKIASALQIVISPEERLRIEKKYTHNLSAYEYYLKGRNFYNRLNKDDNENAIKLFRKSLISDPQFALAYSGLADAVCQKTLRFGENPSWLDTAVVYSENALQIDPDLAEAHKALGLVYYTRSWFNKALAENKQAVKLNPNFFDAIHNLGWINLNLGHLAQSAEWLTKARRLNPTFASTFSGLGLIHLMLDDFKQAYNWIDLAYEIHPDLTPNPKIISMMMHIIQSDLLRARKTGEELIDLNPDNTAVLIALGDVELISGDPGSANQYYQQALTVNPRSWNSFTGVNATTSLGFVLWKTDHPNKAKELFSYSLKLDDESLKQGSQWWGILYDMAAIYSITGDEDLCFSKLQLAVDYGFRMHQWLTVDPLFENVRETPVFMDMISDLKLKLIDEKDKLKKLYE